MALADAIRESMSAVMDGEGSEMDIARVIKAVDEDPDARAHWQWLQNSQSLRRTGRSVPEIDVSGRVREVLDSTANTPRRASPLTALAVAASVTLAVVFGGQQLVGSATPLPVTQLPGGVVPIQGAAPVQARFGAAPNTQTITRPPQQQRSQAPVVSEVYQQLARERFARFGIEHAEATATLQPNGLVAFARIPQREQ